MSVNQISMMMKKYIFLLCGLAVIMANSLGYAQQTTQKPTNSGQSDQVDTRIDNMGYWKKKAEKGLVPYSQRIPLRPAIYKGSQINARGVKTTNSPDVPVSMQTDIAESENSVFVDPNNSSYLLNSNNSTSWSGGTVGTLYGANYFQSTTSGLTWGGTPNGAGGTNSGDPTTAISLAGREYVNYIDDPGGQGIAYSDDGNAWSTATIAPNPGSLADKNHMWIDNKPTSPYEGNLYTAWTDFGGTDDTQIKISRSTNDGVAWSTPINLSSAINAGSHNQGVNIQTGPNGEVYVAWAVYDSWPSDESAIGFAKSTNGGVSYQTASRIISNIKGIRTTTAGKNHRVNSFPVMAVDISSGAFSGNIYIVWTNIGTPGTNSGTNKSVYIIRSSDGGSTWSTPIRVNQGAFLDEKASYFPWISCDPETGVLSVVFYDDRDVSSAQNEVYAAYSTDAGNTWTDFKVSDVAFTPSPIPGLASSYMGDYLGITSKGGKVYPCWTDNRDGIYMTYVSPFELGLNAGFSANNTLICTGSTVTFTSTSTGPPTSWIWSFPGGSPSSYVGPTPPPVTYSSAGSYDVSLTVSDGVTTDTETKTGYIVVKDIIANFTGAPTTVVIGNSVTFTDNSSCSPTSWEWSFPGGTPSSFSGQTPPAIVYSVIGTYDVTLVVSKPGSTDTKTRVAYINVTPPIFNMTNGSITTCTGNFYDSGGSAGSYQNSENFTETFYPSTPGYMTQFTFTSFATESGYDYLRIYNGTSTAAPLIGTYNGSVGPGTVLATNVDGALTFNFTSDVSVTYAGWSAVISCYSTSVPPVAQFAASSTSPAVGSTVTFTDQSSDLPTAWSWSFSPNTVVYVGGTNANSQNPQVQFSALGQYTVTLVAGNAYGTDSEIKTNYISVIPFSYCIPTYTSGTTAGDYITLVQLGTINNATGASPSPFYTYYSSLSTDLTPGSAYTITLSPGTYSSGNYIAVWIDYNQNGVFDADENLGTVLIPPTPTTGTINFTVPATATSGTTRMRVREVWNNSSFDACTTYSYGETEDYNVNIQGGDKPLNLTLFLEGLFNGSSMNKAQNETGNEFPGTVADQIVIELRTSSFPYELAGGPYTVDINTNGTASLTIPFSLSSSYYVVVRHRNSIETWSGAPLSFSGASIAHDFTTASGQAYGDNMKLVSGKYVIYSGDVNQDGIVDSGDMIPVDNGSGSFMTGYVSEDTNGDGLIDSGDMILLDNNSSLFIVKITP